MARPKGEGPADEEVAAEATVAAIVKELGDKFDGDLVRKVATKMYTSFSGHFPTPRSLWEGCSGKEAN